MIKHESTINSLQTARSAKFEAPGTRVLCRDANFPLPGLCG